MHDSSRTFNTADGATLVHTCPAAPGRAPLCLCERSPRKLEEELLIALILLQDFAMNVHSPGVTEA